MKTLGVGGAAKELNVTCGYIYQLLRDGRLSASKVAGRWLIDRAAVEARKQVRELQRALGSATE